MATRTNEFRRRGIAPKLLIEQVLNTACWAVEGAIDTNPSADLRRGDLRSPESWRDVLRASPTLEDSWQTAEARAAYLRVMLAAHFSTVATFVPTDVDTHIRFHVWQEINTTDDLQHAIAVVDEAAAWDPRPVSARTVAAGVIGEISGHAGEWLAVRAGALGRALAIGATSIAEHLVNGIEAELSREARAIADARRSGDNRALLSLCSISAHNCGDLSRVVEAWPSGTPERDSYMKRYAKLGHSDSSRYDGQHHIAGHVNKEVMASENHRFLALRAPRGLRRGRALLIPIGPFFDVWGETIGTSTLLDEKDRGEVVAALATGLEQSVDRWGYHRALAGIHRTAPGGIDRLVSHVPARLRHHIQKGPVRDALRLDPDRFMARMDNALKASLATYRR